MIINSVSSFSCSMALRRRRRRKQRQQLLWSRLLRVASLAPKRLFPPAVVMRRKRRASWIRLWNLSQHPSWICSIKSNGVFNEIWLTSYSILLINAVPACPTPTCSHIYLHPCPAPSSQLLSVLELRSVALFCHC